MTGGGLPAATGVAPAGRRDLAVRLRRAFVRRLPLLLALGVGYLGGWHLLALWPDLASPGYGWAASGGSVLPAYGTLLDVQRGLAPRSSTAGAEGSLEERLDELVERFHDPQPVRAVDVPSPARQRVESLVAAYRRVFPTFRRDGEQADRRLAAASAPPAELVAGSGPALRRALAAGDGLSALWAALQGHGPPPEVAYRRSRRRPVVRFDAEGVAGRLRLYGDGTAVVTGSGPEPPESELDLGEARVRRLLDDLLAGGILAPDLYHGWLADGAAGCEWLVRQRRFLQARSESLRSFQSWPETVTVAVEEASLPGSTARVGPAERTLRLREGFLSPRCVPDDPVVARLQTAATAIERVVGEVGDDGRRAGARRSATRRGRTKRNRRALPGLAVLYTGARGDGIWITDGRSGGQVWPRAAATGLSASRDGSLVAFRSGGDLVLLDRGAGGEPRRLGPPGWQGRTALWSPDGTALVLGGQAAPGSPRMFLADALGRDPVALGEPGAWPLAWSAGGELVYYRRPDRSVGAVRRSGETVELELPGKPRWVDDLLPAPRGDRLAYQAIRLRAGQPGAAIVVLPTVAGGLPRPGAEPLPVARSGRSFDWSPSGDAIVYAIRRALREVGPDGFGDRELLGQEFGDCYHDRPRLSPDGEWILFQRCAGRSGEGYIYVARRDGRRPRRIAYGGSPSWVEGGIGEVETVEPPPPPPRRGRSIAW